MFKFDLNEDSVNWEHDDSHYIDTYNQYPDDFILFSGNYAILINLRTVELIGILNLSSYEYSFIPE